MKVKWYRMPVNGRLDYWRVRVHVTRGFTYVRRIRRDGSLNKKALWVRTPETSLLDKHPETGKEASCNKPTT